MVLWIITHPCYTFSFITSGSKFRSRFRKLNLRKEITFSHQRNFAILFSMPKQKSQRWPTSIFYGFQDINPWRLRRVAFTENKRCEWKIIYIFQISALYLQYSFINEFLNVSIERISTSWFLYSWSVPMFRLTSYRSLR